MLGKLLRWSTVGTLALTAVTLAGALVLPDDTDGTLWVGMHLVQAMTLAWAGTVGVFGVWAVDRIAGRAVASVQR